MIIDSHAHLNFEAFNDDLDEVINRCNREDITVINVGSQYDTSKRAIEIAEKYDNMYAAIGLHPIHAENGFNAADFLELAKSEKVVAIGEIGIDYFRDYGEFKEKQFEILHQQLDLAKELDLPLIIHCRKAHKDLIEVLEKHNFKGVVHCFTGSLNDAKRYLEMGYYIGINGIMYKLNLDKVIKEIPLDKILIETDCPYLTPPAARMERNEPIFTKYIVADVARLKGVSIKDISDITVKNTRELFSI